MLNREQRRKHEREIKKVKFACNCPECGEKTRFVGVKNKGEEIVQNNINAVTKALDSLNEFSEFTNHNTIFEKVNEEESENNEEVLVEEELTEEEKAKLKEKQKKEKKKKKKKYRYGKKK